MNYNKKAKNFLKIAREFKLGVLPTEKPHPLTHDLSNLSKTNLIEAINLFKTLDLNVLKVLKEKSHELEKLSDSIFTTIKEGGRVFLCGCGATGRLSLSLEFIWRSIQSDNNLKNKVIGFMAGGDAALIKSIENFEDHPEFAAYQLEELGFKEGDLLISSTEGGETPFVIGATEYVLLLTKKRPFFLYCNPDNILKNLTERTQRVMKNSLINKINLYTGEMALSGSTRLQASTILMLAIGLALLKVKDNNFNIINEIEKFEFYYKNLNLNWIKDFIIKESEIYKNENFLLYKTDDYGITVLTDTTERSPTFSLRPFENQKDKKRIPSLAYLSILNTKNVKAAWRKLLNRTPRCLNFKEYKKVASLKYFYGFDISEKASSKRKRLIKKHELNEFQILKSKKGVSFKLNHLIKELEFKGLPLLFEHVLLKLILNTHSTLLMGRMGRYETNIMVYVKPSNNKLIDRAARYIINFLEEKEIKVYTYEDVIMELFKIRENLKPDESIVLKTLSSLEKKYGSSNCKK